MVAAIVYTRVSTREQEREGYSIPAQRKLLAGYARSRSFHVEREHEFIDIESAKNPGRKEFSRMLRLLATDGAPRIVLVEKTDRLYRNRADALAFEELIEKRGIEVHLVKEGRVVGKDSRSQDKFMHDIHVAVAKHYVENLKEEVKKGMREKAEEGIEIVECLTSLCFKVGARSLASGRVNTGLTGHEQQTCGTHRLRIGAERLNSREHGQPLCQTSLCSSKNGMDSRF